MIETQALLRERGKKHVLRLKEHQKNKINNRKELYPCFEPSHNFPYCDNMQRHWTLNMASQTFQRVKNICHFDFH